MSIDVAMGGLCRCLAFPVDNSMQVAHYPEMARQIIEKLVDDIDGSPADSTITFSVDGITYTIDLNNRHENSLRTALGPFLEVARKVRSDGRGAGRVGSRSVGDKERNAAIRAWALSEGVELPSRGRIAGIVQEAYEVKDGAVLRAGLGLEEVEEKPRRRRKPEAEFSAAA